MRVLSSMNQLLKKPDGLLDDESRDASTSFALLAGSFLCYAGYATASGLFQGGSTVALAIMKVPLIIFGSVLLCLPSLYVFTALAGAGYSAREFGRLVSAFCAIAGLILLGLMPITWLFSVSTTSLRFVVWMHVMVWLIAILFGRRILLRASSRARTIVTVWVVLLLVVSLQMTTHLRPVLWRDPGQPIFAMEKKSFVTHASELDRARVKTSAQK